MAVKEEGSISILTIGLFLVTVSALFLVTDIASIIVAKRSLAHVTEAAAMRATHQLDLGAYYRGSKESAIPIDCASALSRITDELGDWISTPSQLRRKELHRVEIVGFSCEENRILLTTTAVATLPFRLPGSSLSKVEIHATVAAESNRSQ
ncbi:MAG: pilus assembly protein TadG-related protein [Candidatus Nanopelagicaceae bacterium]|nr:pilus assembly protein TadG-related protein [Candidatus Nanopelagicaceae bacterium]